MKMAARWRIEWRRNITRYRLEGFAFLKIGDGLQQRFGVRVFCLAE